MKITHEVRDYAAKGMDDMSKVFKETGGEVYQDKSTLEEKAKEMPPAAE